MIATTTRHPCTSPTTTATAAAAAAAAIPTVAAVAAVAAERVGAGSSPRGVGV